MTDEEEKKISELAEALGFTGKFKSEFEVCAEWITQNLKFRQKLANLPAKPKREIRTRQNILDYIRAPDGLGPWYDAGVLTRPLMLEIAPKAYSKFAHFLKKNELPPEFKIDSSIDIINSEMDVFTKRKIDISGLINSMRLTGNRLYRLGL